MSTSNFKIRLPSSPKLPSGVLSKKTHKIFSPKVLVMEKDYSPLIKINCQNEAEETEVEICSYTSGDSNMSGNDSISNKDAVLDNNSVSSKNAISENDAVSDNDSVSNKDAVLDYNSVSNKYAVSEDQAGLYANITPNNSLANDSISDSEDIIKPQEYVLFYQNQNSEDTKTPERNNKYTLKEYVKARVDVINKSLLRMVRRFFHRIFIKENKKLVKRRFVNVRYQVIFDSAERLINNHLGIQNNDELTLFLIRMLSIRCQSNPGHDPNDDEFTLNYTITMGSYSRHRYSKIHKCRPFRILYNYLYTQNLRDSETSCLSSLYENEKKHIEKETERYHKAFNEMGMNCREFMERPLESSAFNN